MLAIPLRPWLIVIAGMVVSLASHAQVSSGVWFNYKYQTDPSDNPDRETWGTLGDEAFVLYFDHQADQYPWLFSGEFRAGPGSFTDPVNNSSGSSYLLHKAYIAYQFENTGLLKIGKSQVPFGWKTDNFWPGDMLLGGYGDQMDVGLSYSMALRPSIPISIAYFHADDWGSSSTDSSDDNGHWGSSSSYRKTQTLVADMKWNLNPHHTLGTSIQAGLLQDLNDIADNDNFQAVTGHHQALSLYYIGALSDTINTKFQIDAILRDLPDSLALESIENIRAAGGIYYRCQDWDFYFEATAANSSTKNNDADTVFALSPGAKYDYGNGWIYVEYLNQSGFIDRNGDVGEGDFAALYVTLDYYFNFQPWE